MRFPDPPRGLKSIPWRMPIWFYRLGLGWMLGNRLLLLSHTGCKSGKIRQTVLEIIHYSPENHSYYLVSGFGTRSHWYQNIKQDPRVTIQVGSNRMTADAQRLEPDEAENIFLGYTQKYPRSIRLLAKVLKYDIVHTTEGYQAFGREIPLIRLTPRMVASAESCLS
ncbi:MAG: nitroreductase family deazaflavin-dependent oxidoreductase [Anaerolineales bacterium]